MTAATGCQPQAFPCPVSEDFEIRHEEVQFVGAMKGRGCQPGLGQESVHSFVLVLEPQQVLHQEQGNEWPRERALS